MVDRRNLKENVEMYGRERREMKNMPLSEEARQLKNESRKNYWLKKAHEYGIDPSKFTEEGMIREARRIYDERYWEKKAREKAGD